MADGMKKCDTCGADIAKSAKTCPQCGAKNKKPITKRWWFWAIIVIFALGLIGNLTGVEKKTATNNTQSSGNAVSNTQSSDSTTNNSTSKSAESSVSEPLLSAESAYQAILDEYSKKIRDATPELIDEYNAEAKQNMGGLQGLAEISNAKVSELAEISNEGVSKMAEVMMTTGSGKYDVYEEWAGKLMDVYMEEAGKITDAYMSSAMG